MIYIFNTKFTMIIILIAAQRIQADVREFRRAFALVTDQPFILFYFIY